jgi:ubiquinone/menaquinone biosynthesis C-methylase UbiE
MTTENTSQQTESWNSWWDNTSPESEIQKWDFYGLRPWILKYTPRYGKVTEAGCGMGRWVFYLSELGIEIEGMDFLKPTVDYLNEWKKQYNFNTNFIHGNVENLPYKANTLSGYLSFGVVEHFIEGPQKPLEEAYRVLRPGGVAIITTPAKSWAVKYLKTKSNIKRIIKSILGRKVQKPVFFQYEYTPRRLASYVKKIGLHVTQYSGSDLFFMFNQIGKFTGRNIQKGTFGYWFSNHFENTILKGLGAQSVTISVKVAPKMYCFLSGEFTATPDSLARYTVPISKKQQENPLAKYYLKKMKPKYHLPYIINPPFKNPQEEICEISGKKYLSDPLFEDYGFNKKVHPKLLKTPNINIELSNTSLQPIWRNRIGKHIHFNENA